MGRNDGAAALPRLPRHLLDGRDYATLHAVQATRGCPNRCTFCAVTAFHRGRQHHRPVVEVAAEVAALPDRFFVFVDDNLVARRDYAAALFRALLPLRKTWVSQATLDLADDPELVRLAAASGCIGLFVGLETFSEANLRAVDKGCNRVGEYRHKIDLLHAHGIGVEAGMVFGFDRDDAGVFRRTLSLLDALAVDLVQVSILTPLPGTPFHDTMKDRIFDHDWSNHDFHHVVFSPRQMTPDELQAGHDSITRQFYRPWRIARRLLWMARRGNWRALPYAAALNVAYYGRIVRWGLRGREPGRRAASVPCHERVAASRRC